MTHPPANVHEARRLLEDVQDAIGAIRYSLRTTGDTRPTMEITGVIDSLICDALVYLSVVTK